MTWGLGNVGPASIASLAKDLRRRFAGEDAGHPDWAINPDAYTIDALTAQSREFLYDGRYDQIEAAAVSVKEAPPILGFLVAGYSSGADVPNAYVMHLGAQGIPDFDEVIPEEAGAAWWGQPDAIARILTGLSVAAPEALVNLKIGLDAQQAAQVVQGLKAQLNPQMVPAASAAPAWRGQLSNLTHPPLVSA